MLGTHAALVQAGLLPEEMPANYTYKKVRKILSELDAADATELSRAVEAASRLGVSGPLAVVIFIKHHLGGAHEAEIDRIEENEEQGIKYGVLVYPEGELPIKSEYLPENIQPGSRVRYEPSQAAYTS